MILLGWDWLPGVKQLEVHDTDVFWDHGYWHWVCTCRKSRGYGKFEENIRAAAQRHEAGASPSG